MAGGKPENYARAEYFQVDISNASGADSTDGAWHYVTIPKISIQEAEATVGGDPVARHNLGRKEWSDLVLRGPVTDTRKAMLTWYQDTVKKGVGKNQPRRNISIMLFNPD